MDCFESGRRHLRLADLVMSEPELQLDRSVSGLHLQSMAILLDGILITADSRRRYYGRG